MLISFRNFGLALLISLLVFGVLSYFVVGFIKDSITGITGSDKPPTGPTVPGEIKPGEITGPDDPKISSMTVLIAGVDSGASQFDGKQETDAILLLHIDAANEKYMC